MTVDDVTSLHRLYLDCERERDQAVQELDLCMANLAGSEVLRRRLAVQVFLLMEQVQALELQVASAQGR